MENFVLWSGTYFGWTVLFLPELWGLHPSLEVVIAGQLGHWGLSKGVAAAVIALWVWTTVDVLAPSLGYYKAVVKAAERTWF